MVIANVIRVVATNIFDFELAFNNIAWASAQVPIKQKSANHGAVSLSCALVISVCMPSATDGKMEPSPIHSKYLGALNHKWAAIKTAPMRVVQNGEANKKYWVSGRFTY